MNTRKRLVNFRVTDEEFQRLKTASSLKNARCLSDFARSAILEVARTCESDRAPTDPVADRLQAFDGRLARLESSILQIIEAIAGAKSAAASSEG
jgi:hypothetical protein